MKPSCSKHCIDEEKIDKKKDNALYSIKLFELAHIQAKENFFTAGHSFSALFSTEFYVYVIYSYFTVKTIKLARFCKTTHVWEPVNVIFPKSIKSIFIYSCTVLWDKITVVIFLLDALWLLDLPTHTFTAVDISSICIPVTGTVPRNGHIIEGNHHMEPLLETDILHIGEMLEFSCNAIDQSNRCIYVQCRTTVLGVFCQNYVYKLDWDTKEWTMLTLKPIEKIPGFKVIPSNEITLHGIPAGKFMALWNGYLFIGLKINEEHMSTFQCGKPLSPYEKMIRINLKTLEWNFHKTMPCIKSGQTIHLTPTNRSELRWAQVGSNVYAICALTLPVTSGYDPNKLSKTSCDIWSINLPTLQWTRNRKFTFLTTPMKDYMITVDNKSDEIWLIKKDYLLTNNQINMYRISVGLPKLFTLARDAFFFRPPAGIRAIVNDRNTADTLVKIMDHMDENGLPTNAFKFTDIWDEEDELAYLLDELKMEPALDDGARNETD